MKPTHALTWLPFCLVFAACSGPVIEDSPLTDPNNQTDDNDDDWKEDDDKEDEWEEEEKEDEEEEKEEEEDWEDWEDDRSCLRAVRFAGGIEDGGGWLGGVYKAGRHGNGEFEATLSDEGGWYLAEGEWSSEGVGGPIGEMVGYIWEDGGTGYLYGYVWNDETEGRIEAEFPWNPEKFTGEGWWSFAQSQFEAKAWINDDWSGGGWEGTWYRGDRESDASGRWGFDDGSDETGWLSGTVQASDTNTIELEGQWDNSDDSDEGYWRAALGEWGILEGSIYPTSDTTSSLSGVGFPFGCD